MLQDSKEPITFDSSIKQNNAMNNLNIILAQIEKLEAKQWNFTITFEEAKLLHTLVEMAEQMVK